MEYCCPKQHFLPYLTTFNLCACSQTIDELLNSSYYSDFKKKNRITHCFQLFLQNLKVSNVDIAWSQHDNNKDVETDSSFFFFTLLNLSENYFHKSQTNNCHGNVNGGKYPHIKCWCEWHDISAFQILHTRHTILCSSCGGNLRAQFTDQPDLKRYTVLCKQARVNSRLRHF